MNKSIVLFVLLSVTFSNAATLDMESVSELIEAINQDEVEKIKAFFVSRSPDTEIINGYTALVYSSLLGKLEAIKVLVALGARLDVASPMSPLGAAVSNDQLQAIRVLVKLGASPDFGKDDGITPLCQAVLSGKIDVIRVLVELGATVDRRCSDSEESALALAAGKGDVEAIEILVLAGAQVNQFRPVTATKEGGSLVNMMQMFDERNAAKMKGIRSTPLYAAVSSNHPAVIVKLHELGASLESVLSGSRLTALHAAAVQGQRESLKTLILLGADLEAADEEGLSPLMHSIRSHDPGIAEILIQAGAKLEYSWINKDISFYKLANTFGSSKFKSWAFWHKNKRPIYLLVGTAVVSAVMIASHKLWKYLNKPTTSQFVRKKLSQRQQQDLERLKRNVKKSFDDGFSSRPSFFGKSEFIPLAENDAGEAALLDYLRKIESDYYAELEHVVPLVSDDDEESTIKSEPKRPRSAAAAAMPKAKRPQAQQQVLLPQNVTWDDIYQTRKFEARYGVLEPQEREQVNRRLKEIVEARRYSDHKQLTGWTTVIVNGKEIRVPIYEFRFQTRGGMRLYFTTTDGKTLHLLLIGYKDSQEKDIASLKQSTLYL